MQALGQHLLLELFDCDPSSINNLTEIKAILVEAAKRARATIVDLVFHEFNPFGISGIVIIAESHLSVHTWPEYRYAAADIFSCGKNMQVEIAADYIITEFKPGRVSIVKFPRGTFMDLPAQKQAIHS